MENKFEWTDDLVIEFARLAAIGWEKIKCADLRDFKEKKMNQVLFTTMDGKAIRISDYYWQVDETGYVSKRVAGGRYANPNRTFSTMEAAQEWVSDNKKNYSVAEVKQAMVNSGAGMRFQSEVIAHLRILGFPQTVGYKNNDECHGKTFEQK